MNNKRIYISYQEILWRYLIISIIINYNLIKSDIETIWNDLKKRCIYQHFLFSFYNLIKSDIETIWNDLKKRCIYQHFLFSFTSFQVFKK